MSEQQYLTDEELEQLIFDVEEQDMVSAPPDLLDSILLQIEKSEVKESNGADQKTVSPHLDDVLKPPKVIDYNKKKKEFRFYCIKVVSAAAVLIGILFLNSGILDVNIKSIVPEPKHMMQEQSMTKEEYLQAQDGVFSKLGDSDVISKSGNKMREDSKNPEHRK